MKRGIIRRYRELLSQEIGTVRKEPGGKLSVCLAYPNTYYLGMSNLGFQKIYQLINQHPSALCERAFLPDPEEGALLEREGLPLLSLESQRPLRDFDILAFSVNFESDYVNLVRMLRLARIPIWAAEREDADPLVIMGGTCSFYNPEPVAPFLDAVVVGEGEEVTAELLDLWLRLRSEGEDRPEWLPAMAQVEGVYIPAAYEPRYEARGHVESIHHHSLYPKAVVKRAVEDLNAHPTSSVLLTPNTEFGSMYLLEVQRGCSRRCGFCLVGFVLRSFRNYAASVLIDQARRGLQHRNRIGLVGSAITHNPEIGEVCRFIVEAGGEISFSSIQIDTLTDPLIDHMLHGGQKTLTFAPEAGTERLRWVVGKKISDEKLEAVCSRLYEKGMVNLKLYVLIGVPTETQEDVEALVTMAKRLKHLMLSYGKARGRAGTITLSVNPFVPKPWTPFQWEAMESAQSLREKLHFLRQSVRRLGNIAIVAEPVKWAAFQALLARGDRKVAQLLVTMVEDGLDWQQAIEKLNLNPAFYVNRARSFEEVFPWDWVDVGIPKDRLYLDRERYLARA